MSQGPIKIVDRRKFSDMIYYREEELGLKSHNQTSIKCGIHHTLLERFDGEDRGSITEITLSKLAKGLEMTEAEIIEKGGLER